MKTAIIILIIFLYESSSVYLTHQNTPPHLSHLKNQHESMMKMIDQLQNDLDLTKRNMNKEGKLEKKIQQLEKAILRQKAMVRELEKNTKIPLNQSEWTCPDWQQTTQRESMEIADNIIEHVQNLDSDIKSIKNPKIVADFQDDTDEIKSSAYQIKQSLKSQGKVIDPDLFTVGTETSFNADNIVSQGKNDVNKKVQQTAYSNNYVKTCPLKTPFFNGNECVVCPNSKPHFNIGTQQCFYCQDYDKVQQICPSLPKYDAMNNDEAFSRLILPDSITQYDVRINEGDKECPSYRPFLQKGECISCDSPNSLFDYKKQKCTQCPSPSVFEAKKFKCIYGDVWVTNLATGRDRIILPPGTTLKDLQAEQSKLYHGDKNVVNCPKQTPFFDSFSCIDCSGEWYYSIKEEKCVQCPESTVYSAEMHACTRTKFYSNINNPYWISTNPESVQQQLYSLKQEENTTQCPFSTPFFNGHECIACQQNKQFSFDALKCTSCNKNTVFSRNLHQCTNMLSLYQTNPGTAENLIYGGYSESQWFRKYDKNLQNFPEMADCPPEKPYHDGVTCISCKKSHPYFNMLIKMCQVCSKETSYDLKVHECMSSEGNIVVDQPTIEKMAAGIFT